MRSARDTSERWRSCRASFLYESWVYGEVYGLGGIDQAKVRASRAATRVHSTFVSSLPARGERSPIRLSATVPRNAATATRMADGGVSSIPRASPSAAVRPLAPTPASVPDPEMAPSVPGWTFWRVVRRRGVRLKSCPISDSAVSAKAAPREATKAAIKGSDPVAAARMAQKVATAQLARALRALRRPPCSWAVPVRCLLP